MQCKTILLSIAMSVPNGAEKTVTEDFDDDDDDR